MFRDGAMVKDLSTIQNDTVVLYAVWKEPDSSPPGYCTVSADASSESPSAQGTVSMSVKGGLVRIGSSITLVAKASNSNSIFVHWLDEYGNVVGSSVTLKIKPQKSESYWAVFRGKTAAVKPEFTDGDVFVGGGNELKGTRYVKFSARVMTDYSWLPVRFSAKNLPDGLKINPQTGEISGVPTRTKTYRPVITVTSVANPKLYTRVTARITISSMPSWASRRLKGFVLGDDGCTVMGTGNIAATSRGKISGKFNIGGTNWVLSSSSFSYESKEGASVLDAKMVASGTATAKVGKKTFKMPWTWTVTPVYVRVDDGGCIARYTLSAVQGKCVFGSDERMTADLRYNSARYGFFDRWEGYYDWCEPSGGKIRIKMPGGYVSGKTSSGRSVSGVGQVLWDPGSYDDPDAELRLVFYNPPKTVKKKKWPSCGALLDLVNVPGVPVAGEYVAYRRQGVRAETDWTSTGTGSISYSPHNGQAVAGKTVTVKASPRSGSVFAYWLQDGEIVSYSSSYKVTMGDGDHTGLTAVFRLKSDFYYAPETPYIANESDGNPFDTLQVGVAFKARIDINEICRPVKFEAKNLPKGLSLNATTGVISGVPKSSGKKTISIKAKSVAKPKLKSGSLKIPVNVAKLDSWARGTFKAKGVMGTKSASLTLTVGKTGKISGKITVSKKSYSFSSASYSGKTGGETVSGAMYSNGSGQSRIIINGNANGAGTVYSGKAKVKYGSKKRPVELSVLRDAATGKTVVRVSVMDETKVYGYFATEYTSGNCMLNAITLKEKQTVKLVKEYDPEFNEVYDFGVRYYKIKLEKGTSCTIWIEGGNTRNMDLDVDTDWDDENAPFALFDNEEYSDGSVKAAYLHADSWDEDDPSYGTFYVLVSGDVGASAVLRYADGIKQLAPLGHYSRPVEISVPENTDWQSSDVFNVCSRDEFWFSAKIEPETGYEFRAEDEDGNALDIFIDDADGLRVLYDPSRRSFKVAAACNAVKFRIAVLGREYDTSFRLFSCRYCVECEPFEAIKPGLCSGFALHPTGE